MAKYAPFAIAYDFDGTLAPGNMQEHSFIPDCGLSKAEFWTEVKKYAMVFNKIQKYANFHSTPLTYLIIRPFQLIDD
jgi:hypothetical protein